MNIALLAFNRPDYLNQTLFSLKEQRDVTIDRIALFQDGMYNPFSGKRYGDDKVVSHNVYMFEAAFPHGEVHYAGNNIGVALNMERAEQWMFDICEADVGYFLEDDMVLGPYYLKSLQNMVEATKYDPLVGYCACYGPLLRVPDAPPNSLVPMHMNWAFALKRSKYILMAQYLIDYYNLLRDCDYRDRSQGKIMKLREQWNMPGVYTTQDVMHTLACMLTQSIKINSRAHCAKYIGARGLHIDEAAYKAAGFDNIKIYEEELQGFGPVTDELIDQCMALHNKFTGLERREVCQ